jgi:hypothetical protein
MRREDMPKWALDMGVMCDDDLKAARQGYEDRQAAKVVRANLASHSPKRVVEYKWTTERMRKRST